MNLSDILLRPPAPDFYVVVADKIDAVLLEHAPEIDLSRPGGWREARYFVKGFDPRLAHLAAELDGNSYVRMVAVLVERQRQRRRSRLRAAWEAAKPWVFAAGLLAAFGVASNFDALVRTACEWAGGR